MNSTRHTLQFWIGYASSERVFNRFVAEDPTFWDTEDEDEDIPLSPFAASQGESWYDHDFLESGYSTQLGNIAERFQGYSYVDQWAPWVEAQAKRTSLSEFNAFVLMGVDQRPGSEYRQISKPRSYSEEGLKLVYLGEFSFELSTDRGN